MVNVQLLTPIPPGSLLVHLHTWINGDQYLSPSHGHNNWLNPEDELWGVSEHLNQNDFVGSLLIPFTNKDHTATQFLHS